MTGHTAADLIVYGFAGFLLISNLLLLHFLIARKGPIPGYLHPIPSGFILRRPWARFACLRLLSFISLLFTPLLGAAPDLSRYGAVQPHHWLFLWALGAIGLVGAAFLFWSGRPEELILDMERGTYHHKDGWPLFQRVRTGPWSDIKGVSIEAGSCFVYIRWRGGAGTTLVGHFDRSRGGYRYADEVASKLNVPRLATQFSTGLVRRPFRIVARLFFPPAIVCFIVQKFVLGHPDVLDWTMLLVLSIVFVIGFVTFKRLLSPTKR